MVHLHPSLTLSIRRCLVALTAALSVLAADLSIAEDTGDESEQVAAAVESYVAAFNDRDVEKLASHWSPEGVYTSRTTGEQSVGREAIAKEFTALFAEGDAPKLAVTTDSIEFISPNVALERGMATVTQPTGDVSETSYSVVYVKRDGEWLIDRVTEDDVIVPASQYEHLKDLEPIIGQWSYQGEEYSVDIACQWTRNQNYVSRTFKILQNESGEVESSGLQIIGWDANAEQIRSWLFDSDGTFVAGTWSQRDGKWIVSSKATLADGGTGSFTSVIRPLDDGNMSWQKINQVVDGELLPNLDEVVFQKQ